MTNLLSPGPGAYQTKSTAFDFERPKFFMGEKLKDLKANTTVPGAGAYNPKGAAIKREMPSYSMKIKLGSSLASPTAKNPGPGGYNVHLKTHRQAPNYGFGSSTRDDFKNKLNVPGPGSYRLKSNIGEVPEYALQRSDE